MRRNVQRLPLLGALISKIKSEFDIKQHSNDPLEGEADLKTAAMLIMNRTVACGHTHHLALGAGDVTRETEIFASVANIPLIKAL